MSKKQKTPAPSEPEVVPVETPQEPVETPQEPVETPEDQPERTSYVETDASGRRVYREKSIVSGNWITMYLD